MARGWLPDMRWLHTTTEVLGPGVSHSSSDPDLVPPSLSSALLVLPMLPEPPCSWSPLLQARARVQLGKQLWGGGQPPQVLGPTHMLSGLYSLVSWVYSKC